MTNEFKRDAISRARRFVELARECSMADKDDHEMFVEAAVIFGRTAIHRLRRQFKRVPDWKPFWDALADDESVKFLREERDIILKEGPSPTVGQVVRLDATPDDLAETAYYYEDLDTPATDTVSRHLDRMEEVVREAEGKFGQTGA